MRSLFSANLLTARRRAVRDLPLIVVWTALVTLAVLVAVAAPRFVVETIDLGAREAVALAGDRADLVVTGAVAASRSNRPPAIAPGELGDVADQLYNYLPPGVEATYSDTTYGAIGPRSTVVVSDELRLEVSLAMLVDPTALTVVEGNLPPEGVVDRSKPVPAAISTAAAAASGLTVGSVIGLPPVENSDEPDIEVEVLAIVDAVDPDDPLWTDLPGIFTAPVREQREGAVVTVVPLVTEAVVTSVSKDFVEPFRGTIRYHLDPQAFTGALVAQVSEEQRALGANSISMTGATSYPVGVTTTFDNALEPFAGQVRAAVAQFSMIIAGVLGVVASVLVLMSRLLVLRRLPEFRLERARGSSVAATVLRTVPQAVLTVAIAVAVALALSPISSLPFLVAIVAIALLADPVQSLLAVLSTRTAKRMPANRQDRASATARRRARRIALEVTVLALGAGALVALLGRGLLQTTTDGIDPLLAATPVLVAAMVTVVIVRVYPLPVRAAASLGMRSPGIHGLIGSVRARRAIAVLPLLALTLAMGLTTTNAFLGETVANGQVVASWQRVGADARISNAITDEQRAALEQTPGVDAVSSLATRKSSRIEFGSGVGIVTAMAVDEQFSTVLDGLPNAIDTTALDALFEPSDEIPVLLDPQVSTRAFRDTIVLNVGQENVTLKVVGTFAADPLRGFARGPFIYLPLDALNARLDSPVTAETTLVIGPGTDAAIAATTIPPADTLSRATWLADQRGLALVAGVQTAIAGSTLLVALLAVAALLATTVVGTRDRARTLSLLRTLGTPSRFGWWLAVSDLVPLVLAALVGGLGAGVLIAHLLFRAMGLSALTGGLGAPGVSVAVASVAVIVLGAAVLVLVSILVEVVMHRRDRLNEVLRVGETV